LVEATTLSIASVAPPSETAAEAVDAETERRRVKKGTMTARKTAARRWRHQPTWRPQRKKKKKGGEPSPGYQHKDNQPPHLHADCNH
jgi:hypothetical protein